MFLSMLVAWMIPDVPRSLREQLKKENMMLMEFLLNQDQEARVKSHCPKRSIPCFPPRIDIVVEAPPDEEEEEQQVEEEVAEQVEINLDEPRRGSDSDPEIGRPFEEAEETAQEEKGGEGEDEGGKVEEGELEKDKEVTEVDGKKNNEPEEGEEKEEGEQKHEKEKEKGEQRHEMEKEEGEQRQEKEKEGWEQRQEEEKEEWEQKQEEEKKVKAEENFTVDLDAFMSELGLLGERRKLNIYSLFLALDHQCLLSNFIS